MMILGFYKNVHILNTTDLMLQNFAVCSLSYWLFCPHFRFYLNELLNIDLVCKMWLGVGGIFYKEVVYSVWCSLKNGFKSKKGCKVIMLIVLNVMLWKKLVVEFLSRKQKKYLCFFFLTIWAKLKIMRIQKNQSMKSENRNKRFCFLFDYL